MYTTTDLSSIIVERGTPQPYGCQRRDSSFNFSLYSKSATSVKLCLFDGKAKEAVCEIVLDVKKNKTGDVWHILLSNLPDTYLYAYRVSGPFDAFEGMRFDETRFLLDPYAKSIYSSMSWGKESIYPFLCSPLPMKGSFDWKEDQHPNLPLSELLIYEMHVRGFTMHPSSRVSKPGTFAGIVEKIPYLKSLGVNAIELLPVFEFNELEYPRRGKDGKERALVNYWGYSPVSFFAPMNRYSAGSSSSETLWEFKEMVRQLHLNGIEVILDVVFNHTSEGNEKGPTLCFRGLEDSVYYMLSSEGDYLNFSGCGNTVNCNHPVVRELIHESLRYWVTEMHVDGFRFDLASILGRSTKGEPLKNPPLLEQIALDPIFSQTKLIAEAWDASGLYQVGTFPSWGVWGEWNGRYRDTVRRFIKGDLGTVSEFVTRMCGSQDLYGDGRNPNHSVNFVTSHDGFTLCDLVSYEKKRNEENGENNLDGSDCNDSWNCGEEGESQKSQVLALRERQMRNFVCALLLSQGVPMLSMGDEYGHSKKGNNNSWCHDTELNWFDWSEVGKEQGFFRFFKKMIKFRKKHKVFHRSEFLKEEDVRFFDQNLQEVQWEKAPCFVCIQLLDREKGEDLFMVFNATEKALKVRVPFARSCLKVNTARSSPWDFIEEEKAQSFRYLLSEAFSVLVVKKKLD